MCAHASGMLTVALLGMNARSLRPLTCGMPSRPWAIFSEAAFLAISWTWCIGMWLPVLFIRDYGLWSFLVFALPNCIGAAAMGLALAKPGAALEFAQRHRMAIVCFSAVTMAFQMFFLTWLLHSQGTSKEGIVLICLVIASIFAQPLVRGLRARTTAVVVLTLSLGLAAWWLLGNFTRLGADKLPTTSRPLGELGGLAAVCVLGFAMCPFLDATFLKARIRSQGSQGSYAFLLGFLVLFASMICLTFLYGIDIVAKAAADDSPVHVVYLAIPLVFHVGIQLLYTIGVHDDVLRDGDAVCNLPPSNGLSIAGFVGGIIATLAALVIAPLRSDMTNWELFYRGFMSFYGLVFPAYVWIVAWPYQHNGGVPTRQRVAIMAGAIIAATPFYWWGSIDRESHWLYAGVGVVIAAGIIARLLPGPRGPLGPSGVPSPTPSHRPPALQAAAEAR